MVETVKDSLRVGNCKITDADYPVLQLVPACYSKSRQVDKLRENLKIAPQQLSNSKEAFAGNVAEFTLYHTTRPYGTLQEFCNVYAPRLIVIHCENGKVFINVNADNNGRFFTVRGYTYKQ